MATCVILNPGAGGAGDTEAVRAALVRLGDVTVRETSKPAEAMRVTREALDEGFDLIVAAGGDGTVNEVVNGLSNNWGQAKLGLLPLGTGNDFARTIGVPLDIDTAVDILVRGKTAMIDVVCVESDTTRYFVNVSAGGFSGLVDERLTDEIKATWGPLAYLRTALLALPDLQDYHTRITFDDEEPQTLTAYNIVLANARFVAGGVPIAPEALIDDGLIDVLVIPAAPMPRLATLASLILLGRHLRSPDLTYRRAQRVRVESTPGMWFNTDGELVGNEPAAFTVLPQSLEVIVGPDFDAAATSG